MTTFSSSCKKIAALAVVGLLAACGGGGGGDGASSAPQAPVAGTNLSHLQNNLGLSANNDKRMRAATSYGKVVDGSVKIEQNPARISATADGFTTPVIFSNNPTRPVMNGQVVRVDNGASTVMYLPAAGSDMHVGMSHLNVGEAGIVGIFGNESGAAPIGERAAAGGKATYVGQIEYSQEVSTVQATGYRGTINATADFDTGGLQYGSNNMGKFTDSGGPGSMRLDGQATFGPGGQIRGSYTTQPSSGTGTSGVTSGSFYGPDAQNIGMIFSDQTGAGAAILNEAR